MTDKGRTETETLMISLGEFTALKIEKSATIHWISTWKDVKIILKIIVLGNML